MFLFLILQTNLRYFCYFCFEDLIEISVSATLYWEDNLLTRYHMIAIKSSAQIIGYFSFSYCSMWSIECKYYRILPMFWAIPQNLVAKSCSWKHFYTSHSTWRNQVSMYHESSFLHASFFSAGRHHMHPTRGEM